jgi:hypothetical protein
MEFFRSRKLAKAFQNDAKNRDRRASDLQLAEALQQGGCTKEEVYTGARHLIGLEIHSSTQDCFDLGPLLRRSNLFERDALRRQVCLTANYRKFCQEEKISKVYQLVVRPREHCKDWDDFREFHRKQCARLARTLQYATKVCPGLQVDIVSSELGPRAASIGHIDIHFHVLFRFQKNQDIQNSSTRFFEYMGKTWLLPKRAAMQAMTPREPGASAFYLSKGLPHVVRQMRYGWEDSRTAKTAATQLAKLFRQTRRLALSRARGQFRRWLSDQKPTPVRQTPRRASRSDRFSGRSRPRCATAPLVLGVTWVPNPEGRMVHAIVALCPPGAEAFLRAHLFDSNKESLYVRDAFEVELINRVNSYLVNARRPFD